jgi:hypothetical protein
MLLLHTSRGVTGNLVIALSLLLLKLLSSGWWAV